MTALFMKIINMSMTAGCLIIAVILLRLILRRQAPKWVIPILWLLVGVRLVLPVSIESSFSLLPKTATVQQENVDGDTVVISGEDASSEKNSNKSASGKVSSEENPDVGAFEITPSAKNSDVGTSRITSSLKESDAVVSENSSSADVNFADGVVSEATADRQTKEIRMSLDVFTAISIIWIVGMVIILTYGLVSYVWLSCHMKTAVRLRENIYQSEWVKSPFLLGIVRPRIYIPWRLSDSDVSPLEYVIAHEQAHIRRRDHWMKPIGFILLAVYWFNPLVWVAYLLFCKDIEYACDEAVIRHLNAVHRADYSQTLLNCHAVQHRFAACPIAFGETSVKLRVKSILNYRRPTLWRTVIALLLCVVLTMCFLTNPVAGEDTAETERDPLTLIETPDIENAANTENTTDAENAVHVEIQLTDQVFVDADVTPYEDYQNGVSAYYIEPFTERDDYDSFSYEEKPVLFGESLDTQLTLLNSYFGSSLDGSHTSVQYMDGSQLAMSVSGTEGEKLFAYWFINESNNLQDVHVYYSNSDSGDWDNAAEQAIYYGYVNTADCQYNDMSEEVRNLADQAKELVAELTGYKVADYCLCIPLEDMGEDCYVFYCFYTTDGIPWMKQELIAQFDSKVQLSDEVEERHMTEEGVTNLYVYSAEVYSANGELCAVNAYDFLSVGDVYKEKEQILDTKELLSILKNYYDGITLSSDITITDIRLVYNAYFSDSSDGEVSHILTPYWYVQYYMGEYVDLKEDGTNSSYGNHCFIFDAYTGELMGNSFFQD